MKIEVLKSKIHRATVTEANINYVGSITIDEGLMEASNIIEYEKVHVLNINNGERIETYVIKGERGSGVICLNGAAARKFINFLIASDVSLVSRTRASWALSRSFARTVFSQAMRQAMSFSYRDSMALRVMHLSADSP